MEWLSLPIFTSLFTMVVFAAPSGPTTKFGMSPAWCPSGFSRPCFFPSGLKCPPADLKSGASHFAVWWMCTACSPGGRFFRSSLIFTPCLAIFNVAVPTLSPLAFLSSTVVLLLPAWRHTLQRTSVRRRVNRLVVFIRENYRPFSDPAAEQDYISCDRRNPSDIRD